MHPMASAAAITSEVQADGLHIRLLNQRALCEPLREAIFAYLEPVALGPKARFHLELAVEETFMNQVWHAYDDSLVHEVMVTVTFDERLVCLTFEDDGKPFDPTQEQIAPAPDRLEDAVPGGLGLLLVRKFSESVNYARLHDRNRLRICMRRE